MRSTGPTRVAIVSDYFLDFVGGAQTSMRQQQLALEAAGYEVVMVSAARGVGARVRPMADGITITPAFTLPGLELPVIPNIERTRRALRGFFTRERIQVVHVQTEFGLAHAAADVADELGLPVVHTVHTFYWASEGSWHAPFEPLARGLLQRVIGGRIPRETITSRPIDNLLRNLTLAMARRATAVVSPSRHQAHDLESAGLPRAVHVVPNPIATTRRRPVPLRDGAPTFVWVARCETVKRPIVFAEAAIEALRRTDGRFEVEFVGDGTERVAVERLVAGHPQIHVRGSLTHEQVIDRMDAGSVVVLTSVGFDNQPMTIAEAVSRQRGILYCDPKLREGLLHAGFLAPSPDAHGLADAMVELVQSPATIAQLSDGAKHDGAQFSPKNYVARITAVFSEIAA